MNAPESTNPAASNVAGFVLCCPNTAARRGTLYAMTDVRLSDLVDPEKIAALRAAVGDSPPTAERPAVTGTVEVKSTAVELERKADPGLGGAQVLSADDETGLVEALVSVTGVEDRVKDIIEPGAYTKTLGKHEPIGVWSHDDKTWVARTEEAVELMPGDPFFKGLKTMDGQPWPAEAGAVKVKARFNLDTTHGREAYSDVKFFQGKTGWSIGYRATKAHRNPRTGVRHIKELDWFEYSPVMVGAASQPMTLAVKSFGAAVDPDEGIDLIDVDQLTEAEVKARDALRDYLEVKSLEVKATVRRVRTPEGARRFGQPIGSVIVKDTVRAVDLEVGDEVDFQGGSPGDPKKVKGNIDKVERDGNIVTISVDGEDHKLLGTSPVEIQRAKPAGSDTSTARGADAAVSSRLKDMEPGDVVSVDFGGGKTRTFTAMGSGKFKDDKGTELSLSSLESAMRGIEARGEVSATIKPKGGDKPTTSSLAARRFEGQKFAREGDARRVVETHRMTGHEVVPHPSGSGFTVAPKKDGGSSTSKPAVRKPPTFAERMAAMSDDDLETLSKRRTSDEERAAIDAELAKRGGAKPTAEKPDRPAPAPATPPRSSGGGLRDFLAGDAAGANKPADEERAAIRKRKQDRADASAADVRSRIVQTDVSKRSDAELEAERAALYGKTDKESMDRMRDVLRERRARSEERSGPAGGASASRLSGESDGPGAETTRDTRSRSEEASVRAGSTASQLENLSRLPDKDLRDLRDRYAEGSVTRARVQAELDRRGGGDPVKAAEKELDDALDSGDRDRVTAARAALRQAQSDLRDSRASSPGPAATDDGPSTPKAKARLKDRAGGGNAEENAQALIDLFRDPDTDRDNDVSSELQQLLDDLKAERSTTNAKALARALEAAEQADRSGRIDGDRLDAVAQQLRQIRVRATRAAQARAEDAAADARVAERAKLAALNKRRRARGQNPLVRLPDEAKGLDLDAADLLTDLLEVKGSMASLDRSPRSNWVEKAGDLPGYVREVARAIEKTGKPLSQAIPIAISRIKKWAAGGGDVTAETRAKAAKAVAEWEALKAKNRMKHDSTMLAELEQKALDLEDRVDDAYAVLYEAGEFKAQVGVDPDYIRVDPDTGEVLGTAHVEAATEPTEAYDELIGEEPEAKTLLSVTELNRAAQLRRALLD